MSKNTLSTRRRFFGHAGAALSAPLAVATTLVVEGEATGMEDSAARLAALEDVNSIRALQQAYMRLVNTGAHGEIATLFADPAAALVAADMRRIVASGFDERDAIEIAPDGRAATARLHCTVDTATAIGPSCTLVEMARLQGEGVVRRTEQRVVDYTLVKQANAWRLVSVAFRNA